jgi:5-methyltetrahydropteroyltriglutamate--homocysteine methyltransferase
MKKWINSNYHYMVPEVDDTLINLKPDFLKYLADVKRGIDALGDKAVPVVIGPVTMVHLCSFKFEGMIEIQRFALLEKLLPVYSKLLSDLALAGAKEVQIHEPSLVFADAALLPIFQRTYEGHNSILPSNVLINFVSFFEDVGELNYKWLVSTPKIDIISLDLTRGDNLSLIKKHGFPASKTLGAGLIDGRNVWKINPDVVGNILKELDNAKVIKIRIQPSCSLQFVPWNLEGEQHLLSHVAGPVLAFSKQKLAEVVSLAKNDIAFLEDAKSKWVTYFGAVSSNKSVSDRVASLKSSDFSRQDQFEARRKQQNLDLPILPTTTIGSFPQTKEIRSLRHQYKCNKITKDEYDGKINEQIAFMIGVQEALGLDILVHGEPERTDMVEFFGQQMEGMLFSQNGWVQSFGSRCVRPPIFWGDISRPSPMTVREFKVAQALTKKPVKGMLTGPVTILNWSFPRVDISPKTQAFQIALALRDEIRDLEDAGCRIIQVDEPALREAMPLRPSAREEYLTWTVDAFRLATAGAASSTQIHTHMCYCEFDDCMEAIDRMDTDVNSIENARSDDATLRAFRNLGYAKGLGPGTYDIHSPVVPSQEFIVAKITSFLACMKDKELLVINPDCGLKTRAWSETIDSLKNMVAAAQHIRSQLEDESFAVAAH